MQNSKKKAYETPELKVHGNIEKITLAAGAQNADTPEGIADTAFSVV